ncbi:MAG TPA: carbon-nitrogen hydrolase family protein [Burkholderiaceae bacterium]|nr:carbon-nitrogen hydrolase family protein [Burkholderiaceae bacterium]
MTPSERSMPVRVAAVQMVSTTSVDANLRAAESLIGEAARDGARLVALPEYFCLMGRKDTDKVAAREPDGSGPIQQFLAGQAARHRIWLVGGTLPLVAPQADRVMNSTLVYDPSGARIARYDKIHLFRYSNGTEAYDEARTIAPGGNVAAFDVEPPGAARIRVGLSVCYDLRFPELYRALGRCDLLLVPAAFTAVTGRAHWETLLRARAIENLCYVLAPAQGGRHENGRATFGHTMLVDPWGEIVAVRDEGPGVIAGDIDLQRIASVRANLPALEHRVI